LPEEVLVSQETGDDAAVYALPGGQCLVQTVDFFTPIVDDPYDWGRIAAANALSDVYAMGAKPVLALNLVGWPEELPLDLLVRVLEGGSAIAAQAGVAVVGGHSISDVEPKYGMAVTGLARQDRIIRNSTARRGDRLYLTKPLGLGIISTAIKREAATEEQVRRAVEVMVELNDRAAEAMAEVGVDAATDVTGFGLLGHLHTMLVASGLSARLDAGAIPFLPGVIGLARSDVVPGGTIRNHSFLSEFVAWGDLDRPGQLALADAQTSGGLLMATLDGERLAAAFAARRIPLWEVGALEEGFPGKIQVLGRLSEAGPVPAG
jgi:selenide,water dikinase